MKTRRPSIFTYTEIQDNVLKIQPKSPELDDSYFIIYKVNDTYTDDGWLHHEFTSNYANKQNRNIDDIMVLVAKRVNCYYDKKNHEFKMKLKEGQTDLSAYGQYLQIATALDMHIALQ